jgi:hypothetical protein
MSNVFPKKRESFNTLLNAVIPYLIANQTRLNITLATIEGLTDIYGDTLTPGTYCYLYAKWADKASGRTLAVIINLRNVVSELKKMLTTIYEDIPASVWTNTDRLTLRRKRGMKLHYTHRTAGITSNTFLHYKLIGPSRIKVLCFTSQESTRPCIDRQSGADAVQLAICIIDPGNTDMGNELSGNVKNEVVKTVDECPYRRVYTKASIPLTFEAQYSKCDVYIYARQYDCRHPDRSGPWSNALILSIP